MHFLKSPKKFLLLGVIILSLSACKTGPTADEDPIDSGEELNVTITSNNEITPDGEPEGARGTFYLGKYHLFPRDTNGWDENGWSLLTPTVDSRLVYVSSSLGNDDTAEFVKSSDVDDVNNPGLIKPYKTIEAALGQTRDGYPDWVILRRGDVWEVSNILSIKAGRSVFERSVVATYGPSTQRPIIKTQADKGFSLWVSVDFVAIIGISLYAEYRDPNSSKFSGWGNTRSPVGIYMYQPDGTTKKAVLIENNDINFFGTGMVMTGEGKLEDVVIRRNIVRNSYSESSHSQGIYANNASILLEENVFDHNGWYKQQIGSGNNQEEGQATFFNHNTYFSDSKDTRFVNNIFLRSASIQNKWTANSDEDKAVDSIKSENLWIEGNVYVEGEIGISAGGNTDLNTGPRWRNITIQDNIMLAIGRSQPTNRALGWYIDVDDWNSGIICGNYLLNNDNPSVKNIFGIQVSGHLSDVTLQKNTIHGLLLDNPDIHLGAVKIVSDKMEDISVIQNNIQLAGSHMRALVVTNISEISFDANKYFSDADQNSWYLVDGKDESFSSWGNLSGDVNSTASFEEFAVPERSFESYLSMIGAAGSIDTFVELVVGQSKYGWSQHLTAQAISGYIREGYGNTTCN